MNMTTQFPLPTQAVTVKGKGENPLLRRSHCAAAHPTYDVTTEELIRGWGLLQMYGTQAFQGLDAASPMPMRTLPERLAALLLEFYDEQSGIVAGMSFQAIADALGAYHQTIDAILRAFKRQGLVDFGYRHIRVLDIASLQELAM